MLQPTRKILTRGILATACLAFLLGSAPMAQADEIGERVCSNATLHGAYSFTTTGTLNGMPFAVVGRITFDGKGNFHGSGTISDNGIVSRNVPNAGTYSVDSDCTGSEIVSTTGRGLDFVIVDNGKETQSINTAPGTVLITVAKKQFLLGELPSPRGDR